MSPVRRTRLRWRLLGLVAATLAMLAAAALAGCSNTKASVARRPHTGSTTAQVVNGLQRVTVEANDLYRFTPSTITVHPGRVEIDLVNVGKGAPHNWSVLGFTTPLTATGQHSSLTFDAPAPGRYTYVCTIHVKQGQTGTLVVLPS